MTLIIDNSMRQDRQDKKIIFSPADLEAVLRNAKKMDDSMRQDMKMDDSMRQDKKIGDLMKQSTELKIMEEKELGKILQEQSTTNTSYIICYVVLIILVILGIVGYFYFR